MSATTPTIYLIAGCNGAGKTTFAKEFLPTEVKCLRFLNADEIASGLSPLKPSAGAVRAARLPLTQVDECLRRRETFALESALSGKTYHHSRMDGWTSLADAVVGAGFSLVNCHPVKSEMSVAAPKSQAKEPIQLDIVLVCRKQMADSRKRSDTKIAFQRAVEHATSKASRLKGVRSCAFSQ